MIVTLPLLGFISSCSWLPVYKPTIQQGNVFTPDMAQQLRLGMNQEQVRYIMGTPVLTATFNPDRWDYVYELQRGDKKLSEKHLALYFKNGQLVRIQPQ